MSHVSVKPDLLLWALGRARMDPQSLADDSDLAKIDDWVQGKSKPTLRQLEKFARKTMTPLGAFFLDAPPEDKLPIRDFRTVKDERIARPSPNLLDTIHTMQRRQDWMREYLIELGQSPLRFIKSVRRSQISPEALAGRIRKTLGLEPEWAAQLTATEKAFKTFREAAEAAGILVFSNGVVGNNNHRKLDVEEFRGFALVDEYAPLIFINSADAPAAQMFTLAHELAHVWLGESGVSNLPRLTAGEDDVEKYCNAVAAELLVPRESFEPAWEDLRGDKQPYRALGRRFKVSPLVIARRALDLEFIERQDYFRFYSFYMKEFKERPKAGGGNFYDTQGSRLDKRFSAAVVNSAKAGTLLYREAYSLTGLQGRTFTQFAKRLGGTSPE